MTQCRRILIAAAVSSGLLVAQTLAGPAAAYPPPGIGRWDPSITQSTIAKTICAPGYTALVRTGKVSGFGAITAAIKAQVYLRDGKTPDGLAASLSKCCEIDHAFPLEVGGANVIDNLWAESWEAPYGARQKDHQVENKLHALVCAGKMLLADAQSCIQTDWIACGAKLAGRK